MISTSLAQIIWTPKYSCCRIVKRIYDVSRVKIRCVVQNMTRVVKYHGSYPNFVSRVFEAFVGEELLNVFLDNNTTSNSEIVADSPLKLMSRTVYSLKINVLF